MLFYERGFPYKGCEVDESPTFVDNDIPCIDDFVLDVSAIPETENLPNDQDVVEEIIAAHNDNKHVTRRSTRRIVPPM